MWFNSSTLKHNRASEVKKYVTKDCPFALSQKLARVTEALS